MSARPVLLFKSPWRPPGAFALLLAAAACTGQVEPKGFQADDDGTGGGADGAGHGGGDGGSDGGSGGVPQQQLQFDCKKDIEDAPSALARLSTTEKRNSFRDVVTFAFTNTQARSEVLTAIAPALARLSEDQRTGASTDVHGGFKRLDQSATDAQVAVAYETAVAVANAMTAGARAKTLLGACATDTDPNNDKSCVTQFIESFGARVTRRPLNASDREFYLGIYGNPSTLDSLALADVIAVLLASPRFNLHVENGAQLVAGLKNTFELGPFEIASRLSFQFLQSIPDDGLWQAAADGSLSKPDVIKSHVARLTEKPEAQGALDAFATDWLRLDDIPALDSQNSSAVFKTFAGGGLPTSNLRKAMQDEVRSAFRYQVAKGGSLADLFVDPSVYAQDAELARIYGVTPWDGSSEPPKAASNERAGLLTRPGTLLPAPSARTRPIMRGLYVRTAMLCDVVPPPPPSAMADATEQAKTLSRDLTSRELTVALTEQPGSTCKACHGTLLNPIGFALESFDSLGRKRQTERVLDDVGKVIAEKPVDTASALQIDAEDDNRTSQGPEDLAKQVQNSAKLPACFARQIFRFTFRKWEDDERNACALEATRVAVDARRPLKQTWQAIAVDPAFRQRTIQ